MEESFLGLSLPLLRQILKYYRLEGTPKRVLTLGRQGIAVTPQEALQLIEESGLPLQAERSSLELVEEPSLGKLAGYVSDRSFFRMLGIEVHSMDHSSFEKPDLIHDLNNPIPTEWYGRYDQILDGGTLEHVFDIRQSLKNIFELLAVGGEIVHMVPCNNYVNHGFYQFSPTLFFDFYQENQFENIQGFLLKHVYDFDPRSPMLAYELNFRNLTEIRSWNMMLLFVKARKSDRSTGHLVPQQAKWAQIYSGVPIKSRWSHLPRPLRALGSKLRVQLYRHFPRLLKSRREPWGHGHPECWK
jgi:hypothetical protein